MATIDDRINCLEIKQAVSESAIVHLTDQQTRHHREVCDKMDTIIEKVSNFPCGAHDERIKASNGRIDWLYILLGGLFISLVGVAIKAFMGA